MGKEWGFARGMRSWSGDLGSEGWFLGWLVLVYILYVILVGLCGGF